MWLGLQFPDLGLEVFQCRNSQPGVLLEEQRVVACNRAAAAAGIHCGSTLATARSICSEIQYFRRDPAKEQKHLQALAEAMYRFSPQVSIELPDGLTLEVGHSRRLYADFEQLACEAAAVARLHGHRVRHQLAETATAALILARSGARELADVPLVRVGMQIGLPEATLNTLASMGIHHLGGLFALPEAELGQRFGGELVRLLQRLRGRVADPRAAISLRPEFSRQLHLLDPARDKTTLLLPMQRLLDELEAWLVARALVTEQLQWRFAAQNSLTDDSAASCVMCVSFGQGRQQKKAFLPVIRLKLEQIELPEDIITISLTARSLQPFAGGSHGFFDGLMHEVSGVEDGTETGVRTNSPTAHSKRLSLLDELRARLGEHCCHGISSVAEHVPERAWRKHHWQKHTGEETGSRKYRREKHNREKHRREQQQTSTTQQQQHPAGTENLSPARPCWLFDPPRPVEPSQLTLLRGPERIQTAWWRRGILRDYYIARHQSGSQCWAFVDAHGHWFLHGYFA